MSRVSVFVDHQNVYMRAREAFADRSAEHVVGQIHPLRLGIVLTDRGRRIDPTRQLEVVRVFRGEPSPKHSPGGQAACQRQVAAWRPDIGFASSLSMPGMWCHRLGREDFERLTDRTDYTQRRPTRP